MQTEQEPTTETGTATGCPVCGRQPKANQPVPGKVWTLGCGWSLHHHFYVTSWVSAEDCARLWDGRFYDQEHQS